jgi:hypothetical protein
MQPTLVWPNDFEGLLIIEVSCLKNAAVSVFNHNVLGYMYVFFIFYDHTYVLHANLLCTLKKDPCAYQPEKSIPRRSAGDQLVFDLFLYFAC